MIRGARLAGAQFLEDKDMNLVARTLAPAALVTVGVMSAAPIRAEDNGFLGSETLSRHPACLRSFRESQCDGPKS